MLTVAFGALAWIFAGLLVIALGGNRHLARELRNERAARKVADAAYWREVREHDATKQSWADKRKGATPIFDRLAERREAFDRTADEIRGLPEVGGA